MHYRNGMVGTKNTMLTILEIVYWSSINDISVAYKIVMLPTYNFRLYLEIFIHYCNLTSFIVKPTYEGLLNTTYTIDQGSLSKQRNNYFWRTFSSQLASSSHVNHAKVFYGLEAFNYLPVVLWQSLKRKSRKLLSDSYWQFK